MTEDRRRGVDGKVVARKHGARGNQRQHTHQRLSNHGAVSDEAGVSFFVEHLGRGAGRHQRVKTRDRSTSKGDEEKWEQVSLDDRPAAVNVLGEVWKLNVGMDHEDPNDQDRDSSQLHIGRKVIAGLEHQPDWKHRSHQTINGHKDRNLMWSESKSARPSCLSHPVSSDNAGEQKHDTKDAWASDRNFSSMAL